MDPTVCLRGLLAAIATDNREGAIEAATNLAHWLASGGFMPKIELLGINDHMPDWTIPDPEHIRISV